MIERYISFFIKNFQNSYQIRLYNIQLLEKPAIRRYCKRIKDYYLKFNEYLIENRRLWLLRFLMYICYVFEIKLNWKYCYTYTLSPGR